MNSATKSGGDGGPTYHSGETSGNSRRRDTTDGPTLSAAAHPAKTSVAPASAPVLPENALACSTKCLELLGNFSPDGSFGRTSGVLFPLTEAEIFSQSSTPFTTQGMMRNGVVYVHQISATPTDGRGFSLWPTAEAHNTRARGAGQTYEKNKAGNACLARDAQNWPTAQTNYDGRSNEKWKEAKARAKDRHQSGQYASGTGAPGMMDLNRAAQNWPTAVQQDVGNLSAEDYLKRKKRKPGGAIGSLNIVASNWPPARGRFDSGQHRGSKDSLHSKAKDWATPKQSETWGEKYKPETTRKHYADGRQICLSQQARDIFHTPHPDPDLLTLASITSSNFTMKNLKKLRRFLKPSANKPIAGRKSSNAGPGLRPPSPPRRLSKIFVALLMGFPPDWAATDRRGKSLRECIDLLTQSAPRHSEHTATPSSPPAPATSANES